MSEIDSMIDQPKKKWYSFTLKVTFTSLIGALGFFLSIAKGFDAGVYASSALVLGRSGLEVLKEMKK